MVQEGREPKLPTMAGPGRYLIRVRGHLEPGDARRLRGMSIENTVRESGNPVASLCGELPDQAALVGVLSVLHEYQLPLISVTCVAPGMEAKEDER